MSGAAVYEELWIDRAWIDWPTEKARQQETFARHRALMPPEVAVLLPEPPWWRDGSPLALSRLTLAGQCTVLERLFHPRTSGLPDRFFALNPWLERATASGSAPRPLAAETAAGHAARLADFWESGQGRGEDLPVAPSFRAALVAERLTAFNHYPLLWPGGDTLTP